MRIKKVEHRASTGIPVLQIIEHKHVEYLTMSSIEHQI